MLLACRRAPRFCAAAAGSGGAARLPEVNIYQYEICPYCNKVKAFLDWQQVPYKTMDVNPLTKGGIRFSKDYRKVPIAFIDGVQVNDSAEIIKKLVEVLGRDSVTEQLADPEINKWVDWTDKKLSVLLFPNLTRTFTESFEAFGYIMAIPHMWLPMKMVNRLVGGWAMWMANDKIRKKYNIEDEREDLLRCIDEWTVELSAKGGTFHGGSKPDLADVAVLFEVNSFERSGNNRGSFFVGDETLVRDPHVLMATEVAPVMVLLPFLKGQDANQSRFVSLTDIILGASSAYGDCRDSFKHMVSVCRDSIVKQLECICEVKALPGGSEAGQEKVYRFSVERLVAWLAVVVRKTVAEAQSSGLYFTEVGDCATDEMRQDRLTRFMCELCYHFALNDGEIVEKVAKRLNVDISQSLIPSPTKKAISAPPGSAAINQKRSRPSEAKKVDAKRARLEQAAKGCKKISSFFTKVPSKK
ncbi:hypothetical protein FOL47_006554 [Perkinsus chesapeaki]|uniref:GST N-terminal domain-containing protein n=1 Tax=Perkinsus chesapeaki TaxID=330153 RepID=A0A7J6LRA6_PERCH|nr:hypothetical protein FOL47_006554 [Perkinsus chesapeaki]